MKSPFVVKQRNAQAYAGTFSILHCHNLKFSGLNYRKGNLSVRFQLSL